MRQIGTVRGEAEAAAFADYLLTLGIRTQVDPDPAGFAIWVHDEDRVAQSRQEFAAFTQNPADAKYSEASQAARAIRTDLEQRQRQNNTVNLRERWVTPRGTQPLVAVLLGISIVVGVYTWLGDREPNVINSLMIAPKILENAFPGPLTAPEHLGEIRRGEVWRLITPIFLHFGLMHILFNLVTLQMLGNAIEFRCGRWTFLGIVLATAVVSNLAQYEWGVMMQRIAVDRHPYPGSFGGMSGVVYGLFGYTWVKGRFDPAAGLAVSQQFTFMAMGWLILCMTGLLDSDSHKVANAAHVGGLVAGGLLAFVRRPSRS